VKETLPAHEEDDVHVVEAGDATSERHDLVPQRRTTAARGNNEETRTKKHKKGDNLEGIMGRYIDMRMKQAEEEATQLAKEREEKEASQVAYFSIKKCISIIGTMEVTKEEKAKAYNVFKDLDNRQIFLSACDDDAESALIWLRNEMD
jgi:hypothetical protein